MTTIWKFPLEITDTQQINVPVGTTFISSQFQNGVLCLWGIVNPDNILVQRTIDIIGTGNPFRHPYTSKFIATVQQGPLVWHIFEKINKL